MLTPNLFFPTRTYFHYKNMTWKRFLRSSKGCVSLFSFKFRKLFPPFLPKKELYRWFLLIWSRNLLATELLSKTQSSERLSSFKETSARRFGISWLRMVLSVAPSSFTVIKDVYSPPPSPLPRYGSYKGLSSFPGLVRSFITFYPSVF